MKIEPNVICLEDSVWSLQSSWRSGVGKMSSFLRARGTKVATMCCCQMKKKTLRRGGTHQNP